MLSKIWGLLIISSVIVGVIHGRMEDLTQAFFSASMKAMEISFRMAGPLILWLGFMKILQQGDILQRIERILKPFMAFLFPGVPPSHPATGAIILNLGASLLGMGNAATPLGIKAMQELQTLNPHEGEASNAMVTLLALNTSSLTLFPSFVISLRIAQGSKNPMEILICTILATTISTLTAIIMSKVFPYFRRETYL